MKSHNVKHVAYEFSGVLVPYFDADDKQKYEICAKPMFIPASSYVIISGDNNKQHIMDWCNKFLPKNMPAEVFADVDSMPLEMFRTPASYKVHVLHANPYIHKFYASADIDHVRLHCRTSCDIINYSYLIGEKVCLSL